MTTAQQHPIKLQVPISEEAIQSLKIGDMVLVSGIIVTARDTAHKYITQSFIRNNPLQTDPQLFEHLKTYLTQGIVYHCGPVVKSEQDTYTMIAAGPTTSIREEPYQAGVIELFKLRAVIGKGGMGDQTLAALQKHKAVYLHAIGGAAPYIAERMKRVLTVFKKEEFGTPEAFWVIEVENLECIVSMDSHGQSLHKQMMEKSLKNIERFLK